MVISSPCLIGIITGFHSPGVHGMSCYSLDQTVLGKDYPNLLIADSLLKTIWFINAPCYGNDALASPKANELTIPEQTATGKGKSNSFMAGSLPKTTKLTYWLITLAGCKDLFRLGLTSGIRAYEIPPPPPPPSSSQTPTQQTPHTGLSLSGKLYKIGWSCIITKKITRPIKVLCMPPQGSAEEILAKKEKEKARTTMLYGLPEDHLAKFHKMTDAKEMWEAIKSRFGGNDESKKMQKYILKQQFEGFSVSNSEGLHKGYDRFQSLLSQLEIHGAGVSTEDANQKFFRSLTSCLWVFENGIKGSTASSSSMQNVAFVSDNSSSTNDVSTVWCFLYFRCQNSQLNYFIYILLANHLVAPPQLDHEDLEQLDEFDLEEMGLKWQVAMISIRMKKFYHKDWFESYNYAKEPVGFDKTKVECYNCHKTGHFARECRTKGNQDNRRRDAWNSGNKDGRRSYESDSEDEHVSLPTEEQETPSFANQQVKSPRKTLVLLGEKGKLLLSPQQVVIGDHKDTTGTKSPNTMVDQDYPHRALQNKGIVDSGCSRHMTGNKAYLAEYQDFNGGPHFNLFSVSQICDKKNKVLFTDSECLVLSPDNLRTGILLNSVGQKGSRGNTVMPELHNKMELLKERTGPLLRLLGLC
ncbi:ribonuclease H-like domain-containing protein [Tanacetum coccineum]